MTQQQTQLAAELEGLTQRAFDAFCEDIAGMFDCSMQTTEQKILRGNVGQLKKEFGKITSINTLQAQGVLNGQCAIWFDQAALFILSGIIVMLPEKRIQEQVKSGALKDAQALTDAIKELGNLMTGSWDRIFRQSLAGHKHLKQVNVYIGQPWGNPKESIQMEPDHECLMILSKIKVGAFEPVLCAAVFPVEILEPKAADEPAPAPKSESQAGSDQADKTPAPVSEPSPSAQQSPEPAATDSTPPANQPPATESAVQVETIEQPARPSPVSQAIEQLVGSGQPGLAVPCATMPCPAGALDLNCPVQNLVSTPGVWIDPDASIQQAILLMQQHNTSYLLAGKNGQLEGLLSRSDTAAAISPYTKSVFAQYRRPQDDATFQIRVKWFVSRPVRAIRPDTPLWAAIDILCKYAIRCLVILDSQQRVTGVITVFDIFKKMLSTDGSSLAGQISQPPPFLADMTAQPTKAAARE
ncbi:MAG: CBS domain-containing protein [Sedimentisphaerales bacterium]|nr:CBS domain-containing protein [Sedimentisphaerales bacterium]